MSKGKFGGDFLKTLFSLCVSVLRIIGYILGWFLKGFGVLCVKTGELTLKIVEK